MALYQRRDSVGRTRFLLALSLSTVTALGVAAPLALQALRSDESTFAAISSETGATADEEDPALADSELRSLDAEMPSIGGIRSELHTLEDPTDPSTETSDGSNHSTSSPTPKTATSDNNPPPSPSTAATGPSAPHPESPGTTLPAEGSTTDPSTTSSTVDPESSSTTEAPPITNGETSSTTAAPSTTSTP